MNELNAILGHVITKRSSFQEFCFSYENVHIYFSCKNQYVIIKLKSRKEYEKTINILYIILDLLFLILGRFPTLEDYSWNGESCQISILDKFSTSNYYSKKVFQIADISSATINEKSLTNLRNINKKPLSSMQYLVCMQYDKTITDHKIVLLMHTIDGFVNSKEKDYIKNVKLALMPFLSITENIIAKF